MENKQCPMCGEEVLAVARKCKHCGEYLTEDGSALRVKAKSRLTFVMLGLFLGGFGIHNAYIGRPVRGALELVAVLSGWLAVTAAQTPMISIFGSAGLLILSLFILGEICTVTKDADGIPLK